MGARASFIQAMLIGVVVGAALTVAVFQLRDSDRLSVETKPRVLPPGCDERCCR